MTFNEHSDLKGQHAFLGASKYHWLNYSEEKLIEAYKNSKAVEEGIETHEYAAWSIRRGQKLPRNKCTLNMYVNDAIGFRMKPEQILYYSDNCFGTADAICFDDHLLRIHDLKTGTIPAHMEQLYIYAALFCLEYRHKPSEIDIELRLYQSDEIIVHNPSVADILPIMDKIVTFDKILNTIQSEELES